MKLYVVFFFLLLIGGAVAQNPGCKFHSEIFIKDIGGTLTSYACRGRKFPGKNFEKAVISKKSKSSVSACVKYCNAHYFDGCRAFCYNSKSKICSLGMYYYVIPEDGPMVKVPSYITCGYNDDHEE